MAVAVSANSATVVSGGDDMTVKIWDAESGAERNLGRSFVRSLAIVIR